MLEDQEEFPKTDIIQGGRPIRVALDATLAGTQNTGDSAYWRGLIYGLGLIETDYEFLLFTNGRMNLPSDLPENMLEIPLPKGGSRWYNLFRLPAAARRAGADLLHTQYNLSPFSRVPSVTTIHDVSFYVGPEWFRWQDRFLLRTLMPSTVRRAEAILTVSETSREEIEEFIPEALGKTYVTPNALDPNFDPADPEEARSRLKELYGISGPFALTLGSIWPRKNIQLAVDAAKMAQMPLVVTGRHEAGELEAEGILQTGYVPQEHVPLLYAAAKMLLIPSFHEGFGIPLLESWASGTPVICSSGGALPEVAGDAALVLESWEPADWAEAIRELGSNSGKVSELRERGRGRLNQFSWRTTAEATVQVYEDVVWSRSPQNC